MEALIGLLALIGVSWWISALYKRKCRCDCTRQSEHGRYEFHLALFGLAFFLFWICTPDAWPAGAIGGVLAFVLARRFWQNWQGIETTPCKSSTK